MKITAGELITLGTSRMCCPIERIYALCNYMTGDDLFTHQLPRAFHAIEPLVKKQFPCIMDFPESKCNRDTWRELLRQFILMHGDQFEIEPLPEGAWHSVDPVQELVELTEDKSKVIVVQT